MGAYLTQPKKDKVSSDESNEYLGVGSSSMQGWRNSQEDAHNAILNFDTNTSFFAVYDGHGGAEVATYCADKLPNFLKQLQQYQKDDLENALKEAFLGFDKTLLEPETIAILKVLAGEKNYVDPEDSEEQDDDDDEDLVELHEESRLPISEVLSKMANGPMASYFTKKVTSETEFKPQSPYLRGRRAAAVAADAANRAALNPDAKPQGSSTSAAAAAALNNDAGPSSSKAAVTKMDTDEPEEDSTVSSSSSGKSNTIINNSSSINKADGTKRVEGDDTVKESQNKVSTNGSTATTSSDSASNAHSSHVKGVEQNGGVTSSEIRAVKGDVSTSANTSGANYITVSGSNDATAAGTKVQNGTVGSTSTISATLSSNNKETASVDRSAITSTSKENTNKQDQAAIMGDDDSTDDDADYDVENSSTEDNDASHELNYSSEDDVDGDTDDDDDDEEDDVGEAEDDDDDDEEEQEDEEDDVDPDEVLANEQFCANMIEEPAKDSGCTAVVALLKGRDLYVANAGDSRCVVCRNGKAIDMSLDHKPEDDEESARIIKAGGRVTMDGRVNGGLNLSRAIGDHAYKMNTNLSAEEQMISALPDIKKLIISPHDEFMILACDGIWNYMSSEEVVNFVRLRLKEDTKKLSKICEELFDNCLAPNTLGDGTGCDNMTAVIIRFHPKILELPTKINADETEDVVMQKPIELADAGGEIISIHQPHPSLKRGASPTKDNEADTNANKSKRLKTDEEDDADADENENEPSSITLSSVTTTITEVGGRTITTTKVIDYCATSSTASADDVEQMLDCYTCGGDITETSTTLSST